MVVLLNDWLRIFSFSIDSFSALMIASLSNSISIWVASLLPRVIFSISCGDFNGASGLSFFRRFLADSLPTFSLLALKELVSKASALPALLSLSLVSRRCSCYSSCNFWRNSSLWTCRFGLINTVASTEVGRVLGINCGLSSPRLVIVSIFGRGC